LSESRSDAAAMFSSSWTGEEVPGMTQMFGECRSSPAIATW
jgi:hypothetical protein